jgi:sugar-specific transcriptional regulator TrmB
VASFPTADLVASLGELGLSAYEARVYLALQRESPANGNQISRHSGVPSGKVYAALERLTERGLVTPLGARPVTYVPLPLDEFLRSREVRVREVAATVRRRLGEATASPHREILWHLEGYEVLLDRARRIVAEARREVFISAWRDQAAALLPALRSARRRGVHIAAMLFDAPDLTVGFTMHHVMLRTVYERHGDQLLVVGDDAAGLLMDRSQGSWHGIWTSNPAVLRVIRNYIRHDIYVNKIYHRFMDLMQATYGRELELLLDVSGDRVLSTAPAATPAAAAARRGSGRLAVRARAR